MEKSNAKEKDDSAKGNPTAGVCSCEVGNQAEKGGGEHYAGAGKDKGNARYHADTLFWHQFTHSCEINSDYSHNTKSQEKRKDEHCVGRKRKPAYHQAEKKYKAGVKYAEQEKPLAPVTVKYIFVYQPPEGLAGDSPHMKYSQPQAGKSDTVAQVQRQVEGEVPTHG